MQSVVAEKKCRPTTQTNLYEVEPSSGGGDSQTEDDDGDVLAYSHMKK